MSLAAIWLAFRTFRVALKPLSCLCLALSSLVIAFMDYKVG